MTEKGPRITPELIRKEKGPTVNPDQEKTLRKLVGKGPDFTLHEGLFSEQERKNLKVHVSTIKFPADQKEGEKDPRITSLNEKIKAQKLDKYEITDFAVSTSPDHKNSVDIMKDQETQHIFVCDGWTAKTVLRVSNKGENDAPSQIDYMIKEFQAKYPGKPLAIHVVSSKGASGADISKEFQNKVDQKLRIIKKSEKDILKTEPYKVTKMVKKLNQIRKMKMWDDSKTEPMSAGEALREHNRANFINFVTENIGPLTDSQLLQDIYASNEGLFNIQNSQQEIALWGHSRSCITFTDLALNLIQKGADVKLVTMNSALVGKGEEYTPHKILNMVPKHVIEGGMINFALWADTINQQADRVGQGGKTKALSTAISKLIMRTLQGVPSEFRKDLSSERVAMIMKGHEESFNWNSNLFNLIQPLTFIPGSNQDHIEALVKQAKENNVLDHLSLFVMDTKQDIVRDFKTAVSFFLRVGLPIDRYFLREGGHYGLTTPENQKDAVHFAVTEEKYKLPKEGNN